MHFLRLFFFFLHIKISVCFINSLVCWLSIISIDIIYKISYGANWSSWPSLRLSFRPLEMASPDIFNTSQLVTKFLLDEFSAHANISNISSVEVSDYRYFEPEDFPKLDDGFDLKKHVRVFYVLVKCFLHLILLVKLSFHLWKIFLCVRNGFRFPHRYLPVANMVIILVFFLHQEDIHERCGWSMPLSKILCRCLRYALILVGHLVVTISYGMYVLRNM